MGHRRTRPVGMGNGLPIRKGIESQLMRNRQMPHVRFLVRLSVTSRTPHLCLLPTTHPVRSNPESVFANTWQTIY